MHLRIMKACLRCTKKSDFQWTPEAAEAFQADEKLITEPKNYLIRDVVHGRTNLRRWLRAGTNTTNPEGTINYICQGGFDFEATNNEAEYEALIAGLRIAEQMGVKNLQANVDSRLVANQVNGSYIAKESGMVQYLDKVKTLAKSFKEFSIKQIPRSENKKADALSKIASTSFAHLNKQVLVEELKEKSINEKEILDVVEEEGNTWMTPICEYLAKEILPEDKKKARAVRRKAARYAMINGTLYKKSFRTMAPVFGPLQANYVLREIHEGSCNMHSGPRSVVAKEKLNPITSPWPFYKWGIDIAGPFPEGPSKVKFLIVAMDYFTKWIEAKPVATIMGSQSKQELGGRNKNKTRQRKQELVGRNLSCTLGTRTMIKSSNGDTPFSLTYGTEAVILAEIGMPTFRTAEVDIAENDEALEINLDLIEEKREQAAIREAKSKRQMEKYYNTKVRNTSFKPGDLVYRSNEASRVEDTGKLGPKWEGPYEVTEALGKGSYKLKDRNGKEVPRTWNVRNLKKCYIYKV
ncbi:reverse transcriptase domain-containing protein [Tanacetum coccineum]